MQLPGRRASPVDQSSDYFVRFIVAAATNQDQSRRLDAASSHVQASDRAEK